MAEHFYPTIREEQVMLFNVVVQNLEKDPGYLDHPSCPYPDTVKNFFRKSTASAPVIDLFADGEDREMVLDKQVEKLINDLEAFANTLGNADHSEKLQYYKTKTTLIEKLISMRERVFNLKELNEFRSVVIQFMDEICTKDQITDLMKRLDGVFQ
jgi:hypothetical protein